jgi:aspartate racemase
MKLIGLIGGMSWESSAEYYRLINQQVRARLGGQHSARLLLYSVDFAEIERLQQAGRWDEAGALIADAAVRLARAGADFLLLCTNTMHKVAAQVEAASGLPLLHIADATGRSVREAGLRRVGLLGTRFTMEEDFYVGRLRSAFGLEVIVPPMVDRVIVHRVIFDELCQGELRDASRNEYLRIIAALAADGAEGVILGCTEIPLLVRPADSALPLFDTTRLHAGWAVEQALAG